jgi:ABC-type nickel/cobalt efflux system permease component RcnA
MHSHDGGAMHSHAVPTPDNLSLKGLIALGVSGGIVPCPDAIVVLLVAVALHRILFGLAIIGSFSVGLAAVLIIIGILMVTARPLMERISGGTNSKFTQLYLPVGSAAVVMLLGLGIMGKVLIDLGIVSIHL